MEDWVYTIHLINRIPFESFGLIGFVNDKSVSSRQLERTFEAETLLFSTPVPERIQTQDGTQAWRVVYRMTHKSSGWNKIFRSGTVEGVPIFDDAGALFKIYAPKNFDSVIV